MIMKNLLDKYFIRINFHYVAEDSVPVWREGTKKTLFGEIAKDLDVFLTATA
jgi:hypothetical protein